jgi:hypothetical protein
MIEDPGQGCRASLAAVGDHQDEGELGSPPRGKKFARTANFWT